jgi:hypothetical protein
MQLPSRLSIALGTLTTGLLALSLEVSMPHALHVVCGLVAAAVLFLIHPAETGVIPAPAPPRPESAVRPDGAVPAPPPPGV